MEKTNTASKSRPVVRLKPVPKWVVSMNLARLAMVAAIAAGFCSALLAGCGGSGGSKAILVPTSTPTASATATPTSTATRAPVSGASHENWMSDLAPVIGQRPLRQVVIPGSHDAATYGPWPDPITQGLAQAQDVDITGQLNAGSREFDLRFEYRDYGNGNRDYWNYHGIAVSQYVRMGQVLGAIVDWSEQHPREILMLAIRFGNAYGSDPNLLKQICSQTLGAAVTAGLVLQPSMVPQLFCAPWPYDMSMNEIWALPGHPRIITDWADCTGGDWSLPPTTAALPFDGHYADRCSSSQAVIDGLAPSLDARTDDDGHLVLGLYTLGVEATPELECLYAYVKNLAPLQGKVLTAIKDWRQQNQYKALANLNLITGDFIGDPDGDTKWPIVQTAIDLNQTAPAPQLTQSTAQNGVQVSCTSPQNTSGLQMMAYPLTEGRVGLDSVRYKGKSPGQLNLDRGDFPPGNFDVRVDCTTDQGVTSSLTIPTSDLFATPCVPWGVGKLIQAQGGAEIDVMVPGCGRERIPNVPTLDGIKYTWTSNVHVVTPDEFNNLGRGPDIPDLTTHAYQFTLAMDDIYGAKCFSLQSAHRHAHTIRWRRTRMGPLWRVRVPVHPESDDAASDRANLQPNGAGPAAVSAYGRVLL
ncbi:MAG: hypothetical protein ACREQ4_17980 [Candidatus Binataceae bacterium]